MDEILSSKPEDVDEVRVWTDGPSSQFKNKFVMAAMKTSLELQCNKSQQRA